MHAHGKHPPPGEQGALVPVPSHRYADEHMREGDEKPTEQQVIDLVKNIAREATDESTREIVEPIVGHMVGKIDDIGRHVQIIDEVGHSTAQSYGELYQWVQNLYATQNTLVQELKGKFVELQGQIGTRFDEMQGQIDASSAQNSQAYQDSTTRGESLALHVGGVEAAFEQRLQGLEIAVQGVRNAMPPPSESHAANPQGVSMASDEWAVGIVTQLSQERDRMTQIEAKIGEITIRNPDEALVQDVRNIAQNLQKWQTWTENNVTSIRGKVGDLRADLQNMRGKIAGIPPLVHCPPMQNCHC